MKIGIINTGGTISCVGKPLAPMSAAAFATACKNLLDGILQQQFHKLTTHYVTDLPFPNSDTKTLDSTNLQPTDWCLIAAYILRHYARYDGWVILHGTDSMAFTGTALPFLLSSFSTSGLSLAALSKPIIITGSQVPLFHQASAQAPLTLNFNTDALQNVCGAVAAAQMKISEVCVYFNNRLFRGNRVLKTDANHFDAFSSPNHLPLGEYGLQFKLNDKLILPPPEHAVSLDEPAVLARASAQLAQIAAEINRWPVMQFNAFPAWYDAESSTGMLGALLDACVEKGIKGLILKSYGTGNFPSGNPQAPHKGAMYLALKRANESGVVIINCTRVLRGEVDSGTYAAGSWLTEVGALSGVDMTPVAAFAKLMVLLTAANTNGWSLKDVKHLMQLNLLGEMSI